MIPLLSKHTQYSILITWSNKQYINTHSPYHIYSGEFPYIVQDVFIYFLTLNLYSVFYFQVYFGPTDQLLLNLTLLVLKMWSSYLFDDLRIMSLMFWLKMFLYQDIENGFRILLSFHMSWSWIVLWIDLVFGFKKKNTNYWILLRWDLISPCEDKIAIKKNTKDGAIIFTTIPYSLIMVSWKAKTKKVDP